jgi:tetratricopeptide (TPR) repeat protein
VETGAVRFEAGRLIVDRTPSAITVPGTVQDVIAARLDRLEEGQKRTVQTAAVIGREFPVPLLRRVSSRLDQLEQQLASLTRIELIYEKGGVEELEYVFRHALTQDVAYASLLQSERRRLHALIGAAIEEVYAGRLEQRVEELVHHFRAGEVWDKLLRYARQAGDRAARLFVDARAVEFYETALQALAHLPETPDTARSAVDVRLDMRPPLWRAGQLDRIHARFREAEALATRHGFTEVLDTVYAYLVQYHWAKGNPDEALAYGQRCLDIAGVRGDLVLRVTGHFYRAHAYQTRGTHQEAVAECRALLSTIAGREHERLGLSGLPECGASAMAAWSLAELGDHQGAQAMIARGLARAEAADHLYSICAVRGAEAFALGLAGRLDEAAKVEPYVGICREKNFAGQFMLSGCSLAYAWAGLGRGREAAALAAEAIALQDRLGAWSDRSWMHSVKALGHLAAGQLDAAETDVQRALELAASHQEHGSAGWSHYVAALVALRRSDRTAAEESLDQAQNIADELGLSALLERCRSLARTLG